MICSLVSTEFAKSRDMRAMRASVVYVPNVCQNFIITCQRAKCVPIFKLGVAMCQFLKLMCQRAKRRASFSTIFQKRIFKILNYG